MASRGTTATPGRARRPGATAPPLTRVSGRVPAAAVLLGLGLLLVPPLPVAAQQATGAVAGQVIDATRDAPVGMARVAIPSLDRTTTADGEGRFRLDSLPSGSYELEVSFLGFRTTVRELAVEAGATTEVEVRIAPRPVRVSDLRVSDLALSWFPGFRERREERTGHFFVRREIVERDPEHLTELLRDTEGVRIGRNPDAHGASMWYPQFYYQGPGQGNFCHPAVFVDGRMIGPGNTYWHFNEISPSEVLAMEVYYRYRDLPETIPFTSYRGPLTSDLEVDPGFEPRPMPAREGARPADAGARQVLAGSGLLDGLRRDVPQRDEELELGRTVLAGLYPERPRVEYCGAIFVWTELYPYGDGRSPQLRDG